MHTLWQDLHYAVRMLCKSPAFSIVAVLILALGIGANSAIFSLVHAALLRPLPIPEPERVMRLWDSAPKYDLPYFSVTVPNYSDWREQSQIFEEMAAYREGGFNLGSGEDSGTEPIHVRGARVTAGFFDVLGVLPAAGRTFLEAEDLPGAETRVVVLSDGLWRSRYGADGGLLGRQIEVDSEPHTVIGIMPASYPFPLEGTQLWVPFALDRENASEGAHFLRVLGRLEAGRTPAEAEAEMKVIAARLAVERPESNEDFTVALLTLHESFTGDLRGALLALFGAVGFILLIACANVAHLMLARTAARVRELAVRRALGAGRGRLLRQLLTEGLVLALAGGVAGLLVAGGGMRLLTSLAQSELGETFKPHLDLGVLAFNLSAALVTGLGFALVPAWRAARPGLTEVVRGGRQTGDRYRARGVLVVAEVALALVLLVGAGLMLRSFFSLHRMEPGFDAEHVVTAELSMSESRYPEREQRAEVFRQVLERLAAVPGVTVAGATHRLPLRGNSGAGVVARDQPLAPDERSLGVIYRGVTPGYFSSLGMTMLAGRDLNAREAYVDRDAAVINQRLASHFWPEAQAIGKEISASGPEGPWMTVVGVVADTRESTLEDPAEMAVYLPYMGHATMALVVRTETPPAAMATTIRDSVRAVDPNLPISGLLTLEQVVAESLGQPRMMTVLLGCFAVTAVLLAVAGIYGVLSYGVAQRIREMGLRQALGARPGQIFSLVIGEGARLALAGIGAGLLLAIALSGLAEGFLFQVEATDPLTYVVVSIVLLGVAAAAGLLPARRATRADPMTALRHD